MCISVCYSYMFVIKVIYDFKINLFYFFRNGLEVIDSRHVISTISYSKQTA